jgi:F-type H+-transporting ATPase subunit b
MTEFLHDPITFYALAFIIFLSFAYAKGKKPLLGWLDAEIAKIRDELDSAKRLREESLAVLDHYKHRQEIVLKEAEEIIRHAEMEAARVRVEAESAAKKALIRQEALVTERIRLAEAEAIAGLRQVAIDEAIRVATESLKTSLNVDQAAKLIDQAIEAINTTGTPDGKTAKAA